MFKFNSIIYLQNITGGVMNYAQRNAMGLDIGIISVLALTLFGCLVVDISYLIVVISFDKRWRLLYRDNKSQLALEDRFATFAYKPLVFSTIFNFLSLFGCFALIKKITRWLIMNVCLYGKCASDCLRKTVGRGCQMGCAINVKLGIRALWINVLVRHQTTFE